MYYRDNEWDLRFNSNVADYWLPQVHTLANLQVDYLFPGYTSVEEPAFCQLDKKAKESLSDAVKAKSREAAGELP